MIEAMCAALVAVATVAILVIGNIKRDEVTELGTNFYIRKKVPTIHEEVHICKRSYGWRTSWQATTEMEPWAITSVEDIREYLRTDDWELVDEYGEVHEDWEREIDELVNWDGGVGGTERKPLEHDVECGYGYRDRENCIFVSGEFS